MPAIQDQIGNLIELDSKSERIISLVPSITEYLDDLGLDDKVVGITKFCVHPSKWRKEKEIIGGTKQQHLDKIRDLKPDLIIASKEENVKHYVEKLSKICPVYVSDVSDFDSAIKMMTDIVELTGKTTKAEEIISSIRQRFDLIKSPSKKLKISYCIWKEPWMWAGADTFISQMLSHCGFINIIQKDRYPEIEMSKIVKDNPDYIFLSSEPFPFQEKHIKELKEEFPNANFIIVDGEMFSWYGSRMLKAPQYFNSLLNQIKAE
ncbi:helical backbone metal receptor [Marivirga tractuosa]|uniref:ABC transporter substrate-binding protein n=1 Tax=Marivirga tractuosa TaxID=1006 RepID=UPI0035CF9CAD